MILSNLPPRFPVASFRNQSDLLRPFFKILSVRFIDSLCSPFGLLKSVFLRSASILSKPPLGSLKKPALRVDNFSKNNLTAIRFGISFESITDIVQTQKFRPLSEMIPFISSSPSRSEPLRICFRGWVGDFQPGYLRDFVQWISNFHTDSRPFTSTPASR